MPHSCAVKTCRNKAKAGAPLSFHRLPVREPERLKLWLSALDIDVNTPVAQLKKCIVCSEHFVPEDYTVNGQPRTDTTHRFLTATAVPTVTASPCASRANATQVSQNDRIKDASLDSPSPQDIQSVSEEILPSQQPDQLPTVEKNEPLDSQQVQEVSVFQIPLVQVDTFPPLCPSDTKPVSEELLPSLQQCDIKVEQMEEYPQVKEEQVDQCLSPDMEADTSNNDEVRLPKSDPTTDCELVPSYASVTVTLNEDDEDDESDGLSPPPPHQSHSVEVFVELEQPPRDEKSCRFCGKRFKRDSFLIRHVERSHKGQKAFKCLECNKEFEQRYQLVLHVRIHTGEKPFSCDFCDKTFVQNSSRLAHMRVHTGEKPYYCVKCGKSFATSNHFKFCKVQNECKITPEKGNADENLKEEKAFKCFECNKKFNQKHQLVLHARVHTGEKPFSCDFCGKTFTQNSNRIVHMRQHTGEKPYFCKKCGKRFASSHHLKLCTGTQDQSTNKSFRCTTCGRTFHTDSDLKIHMEVHESWKRHINGKLHEQESKEKKVL